MTLLFYPHLEDAQKGSLEDRIELLISAAEKYKAITLDANAKIEQPAQLAPRDLQNTYNWDEIASVLQAVREMPEGSPESKSHKARLLGKFAEIYEVLRAAKMPKLEAVRLALANEMQQLMGSR